MTSNEIITLVFSGIVSISTVFYVILTGRLVRESRETRKFQETPFLAASIQFAETTKNVIQLKIKNIGLGYAQNVEFIILKDYEWVKDKPLKERGAFKNGVQSFPPNYELTYTLAIFQPGQDKPLSEEDYVELTINYKNIHNNSFSNNYRLKFNEIYSQGYARPPLDNESAKVYYSAEILKQFAELNKKLFSKTDPLQ